MPELPEVEEYRRYCEAHVLRRRITGVDIRSEVVLRGVTSSELVQAASGRTIRAASRHGKYLLLELDDGHFLTLHFGMGGSPELVSPGEPEPRFSHIVFGFADGSRLAFVCPRKLGGVGLARDLASFCHTKRLGTDALAPDLDAKAFRRALRGGRAPIKAALLDQSRVAGVGNLYADESLFQAGIHPLTRVDALSEADLNVLWEGVRAVLAEAVRVRADMERYPETYLLRARVPGGRCPRDGALLQRIQVGGRTTYYCPVHQRLRMRGADECAPPEPFD